MEIIDAGAGNWRLTGYYGFPERTRRRASWNLLKELSDDFSLSRCCLGDFNDMLSLEDKAGGVPQPEWLLNGFRRAIEECNLTEIPLNGYQFTWSRAKGTDREVEERLDRAFATQSWLTMFAHAQLLNLNAPFSDHTPILLKTEAKAVPRRVKHFKFENAWFREDMLHDLVCGIWNESMGCSLLQRLNVCSNKLMKWGNKLSGTFRRQIKKLQAELEDLRMRTDEKAVKQSELVKAKLSKILIQEEDYWRQRAKNFWLSEGDMNTRFFHASASARRKSNAIKS